MAYKLFIIFFYCCSRRVKVIRTVHVWQKCLAVQSNTVKGTEVHLNINSSKHSALINFKQSYISEELLMLYVLRINPCFIKSIRIGSYSIFFISVSSIHCHSISLPFIQIIDAVKYKDVKERALFLCIEKRLGNTNFNQK